MRAGFQNHTYEVTISLLTEGCDFLFNACFADSGRFEIRKFVCDIFVLRRVSYLYAMRFISADCVFPVSSPPVKDGIVVTDDDGKIIEVLQPGSAADLNDNEEIRLEKYTGILCPGFINAHCHLELSHLKGKIPEGKGLPAFIGDVISSREATQEIIADAIVRAEDEMLANGIAGVGDICNTTDTIAQKKKNRLRYHNFIELFDLHPSQAEKEFEKGLALVEEFKKTGSSFSLSPHAPYSVSPVLLKRIHDNAYAHDSLLTLHNQETESENEMFRNRSGVLFEKLSSFGTAYHDWKATGFDSLASTLVHLPRCNRTMLVHNTYSTPEDISWAHLYSAVIYWCLCPNANLYIEKRLPDIPAFLDGSCKMLVGTDSYASNWSLSVLDELKTIARYFPKIKTDTLLKWATLNGAEFFGWKKDLGSFEKGKKPGINLVTGVNTETLAFTEFSEVKPLVT